MHPYYTNVRSEVLPLLTPCERLLDIGCGEGQTALWIKKQGLAKQVYGLELSSSAAAKARNILDDVRCGDIESAEIPFSEIDCVLCLDILEHLRFPEAALRKIAGCMKPGGALIVSFPNVANWRVAIPLLFGQWNYQDAGILDRTHLRFFNRKSACALLEMNGFTVDRVIPKPGENVSAVFNALTRLPLFHYQYLIRAIPSTERGS
jgi:2-polyprenyl-3-methyl-5-hydroxy-6-metoxy-1,4-benzoquinol methylase